MELRIVLFFKTTRVQSGWRKMAEIRVLETPGTSISDIFFVNDRVDKGEIKVQYCPTLLMLADYYTKPLMGQRFREL